MMSGEVYSSSDRQNWQSAKEVQVELPAADSHACRDATVQNESAVKRQGNIIGFSVSPESSIAGQ